MTSSDPPSDVVAAIVSDMVTADNTLGGKRDRKDGGGGRKRDRDGSGRKHRHAVHGAPSYNITLDYSGKY